MKNRPALRIDVQPSELSFASAEAAAPEVSSAPPSMGYVAAPTNLQLSAGLSHSDRTAVAYISAEWDAPPSEVQAYEVRWATNAAFTQNVGVANAKQDSATLNGLKDDQDYYVAVRATYRDVYSDWSAAAMVHTPADTTPPSPPTGAAATLGGDGVLIITGTTPGEANFAALQIRIRGSAGGTIYTTQAVPIQPGQAFRWTWSAEENVKLASGGDGTLVIEVASLNWSGYASTPVVLTATKDAPNTPTVTVAWDAASGTATFTWPSVAFEDYTLTIDTVARPAQSGYAYTAAQNRKEHGGTADPVLTWSLVARDPLRQASAAATGTTTLAAPDDITGASATWNRAQGVLVLNWADVPGVANYALALDGKERKVLYSAYEYAAPLNAQEHAGTADNTISWSIWAVDGLGQRSANAATGTATLPPPVAPTVLGNFDAADARLTWTAVDGCRPVLTLAGKTREAVGLEYIYPYLLNAQEHLVGGVPTASPSLPWSLVMVDGLGQQSTPVSGTLVNAAPSAPTLVGLLRGSNSFVVSISYPETLDYSAFVVRIIKDGATLETITRTVNGFLYAAQASASYTVGVKVRDVFGQESTEYVTPTAITLDVMTPEELRADCLYSDNLGTAAAALAGLKDDTTAPVVTYPAGSGWNYTLATRATAWRVGNLSLAATGGVGYVAISESGSSWSYFAGPLAADGVTLSACASEAAAQAAAIALPTNGTWSLPTMAAARFIKLGHRNTSATYSLAEFYPPTLIVADNIRVGVLRGFTLIGDELVVNELSSLTANLGTVNMTGVITIGSAGGIWQGSAGTFAAPITGYKMYQAANGCGVWEAWNGAKQVYLGSDMALYAAGGGLKLDATGMVIAAEPAALGAGTRDAITWKIGNYRAGFLRTYVVDYRTPADADPLYIGRIVKLLAAGPPDSRSTANPYETTVGAFSGTNYATGTDSGTGVTQSATFYASVTPALSGHSSTVSASINARYTTSGGTTIANSLTVYPDRAYFDKGVETSSYVEAGQSIGNPYKPIRMGQNSLWPSDTTAGLWLRDGDYFLRTDGSNLILNAPGATGYLSLGVDDLTWDAFRATATDTYINAIGTNGQVQLKVNGALKAYADKNGNFVALNALAPGNQTTYYFSYSSDFTGVQTNWDFKVGNRLQVANDIYLGTRSAWLSTWLNQALKTTDSPTFNAVLFGDTDTGIFSNSDGRAVVKGNNVSVAAWLGAGSYPGVYVDYAGNCTSDSMNWGLRFGAESSGEGISSPRAGGNASGLTLWTGYTARVQVGSTGNVSIGTSVLPTSNTRLFVRGVDATSSNYALFLQNGSSANLFYVRNDGYVWSATAVVTSDRRLKKEIRYLDEEESDRVLDLAPVEYTMRMNGHRMYGHIAQDVQSIDEQLVVEGDQGMLGIHESGILALAVLRIQQHERRIDRLEMENADLRSLLSNFGARLAAIEAATR